MGIKELARRLNISIGTVSRALNGHPEVNAETRKRILEIARQLNYKVDKNASSLRCQQSGTLALLFFIFSLVIGIVVWFFVLADMLDGAMARERGYGTRLGAVLDATCDRIGDGGGAELPKLAAAPWARY